MILAAEILMNSKTIVVAGTWKERWTGGVQRILEKKYSVRTVDTCISQSCEGYTIKSEPSSVLWTVSDYDGLQ